MNIKRYAILLCVFLQSILAFAFESSTIFLDYDKAYIVDISVDTTMRLNQLPQYKNKKSSRFIKPHKVHCDFKILYLWKNNYVARILVKDMQIITNDSIKTDKRKNFFDIEIFKRYNDIPVCIYNASNKIVDEDRCPASDYGDLLHAKYIFKHKGQLYSLSSLNVDILRSAPTKALSKEQVYSSLDVFLLKEKDLFKNNKTDDILMNFIYRSLFYNREDILLPQNLPFKYKKNIKYNFDKLSHKGSDIKILSVKNIGKKAIYKIENKSSLFYSPTPRTYNYEQHLCYVPHVLYLPYNENLRIKRTLQFYEKDADYYFKYKINSINGIPLEEFMATYVDDFKPKLVVTKQAVPDPVYTDPTSPHNPFAVVDTNKIYDLVQVQPNFTGGMNALSDYLNKNLNYPPSAREAGVEGKVIIGFIVNKDGSISDVQVRRSLDPSCDEDAVKLIKNMPKWTPGKQDDKIVRVRMALPVVFKLDNK